MKRQENLSMKIPTVKEMFMGRIVKSYRSLCLKLTDHTSKFWTSSIKLDF